MKYLEVIDLIVDEEKAERFLRKVGVLRTFTECPRCGSSGFSDLRGTDLRCSDCGQAWSKRKDSMLFRSTVSCRELVAMAWRFETEVPAATLARDLGLNRNTVNRYYREFREALALCDSPRLPEEDGPAASFLDLGRKGKGGAGEASEDPVFFGIFERRRKASVRHVPGVSVDSLRQDGIKIVRSRTLISTDRYGPYDGLVARYDRSGRRRRFSGGTVPIVKSGRFWRYAVDMLKNNYHGVSAEHFPLYLKELEVRYNSKNEGLMKLVFDCLSKKHSITDF